MSTKKGLVLVILLAVVFAVTASWSLTPKDEKGYPWGSMSSKKKKVEYHPPLLVDINEACEIAIDDTDPEHADGDPHEAWEDRPIVFCNTSTYNVVHINFDNDESTTAGGSIYLNPGECFEATFRGVKKKGKGRRSESGDPESITFEVRCVSSDGEVTSTGTLSWKAPPPDPGSGPPPGGGG